MKDFAPATLYAISPNLLITHPSLPPKTVKEFIAFAQKNPNKMNYSSSGSGSTQHLSGEMMKVMTRIGITHVPYRGTAPSITALLSGEVEFSFSNIPAVIGYVKANRLRAIAITSAKRSPLLPQTPTVIRMRREPANVRFADLKTVCVTYFGKLRQSGSSHLIFKTPWPGDPRINIQDSKGKAKAYQVRQVLLALDKLEAMRNEH